MEIVAIIEKNGLFIKSPEKFSQNITKEANQGLVKMGLFMQGELMKATPFGVTGNARRAWRTDVTGDSQGRDGKMVEVTVTNPTGYIEVVNWGRAAAPISIEGRKQLCLWVQRKFGVDEKAAKRISFFIARKKAKSPTPGQFFVEKTIESKLPIAIKEILEPILQKAASDNGNG